MMTDPNAMTSYEALQRASQLLDTAAVLVAEAVDADLKVCRALNHAVGLLADTSRALVEDTLRGMELKT